MDSLNDAEREVCNVQVREVLSRLDGSAASAVEVLAARPVADAILESRGRIETERLLDAAKQARGEGLLTTTE